MSCSQLQRGDDAVPEDSLPSENDNEDGIGGGGLVINSDRNCLIYVEP